MRRKSRKVKWPHLLGSRWTAMQPVMGWRHFQVRTRQDQKGGVVFAELEAVCDATVRVWVNAKVLTNKRLWQAGWLSLQPDDDLGDGDRLSPAQPPKLPEAAGCDLGQLGRPSISSPLSAAASMEVSLGAEAAEV